MRSSLLVVESQAVLLSFKHLEHCIVYCVALRGTVECNDGYVPVLDNIESGKHGRHQATATIAWLQRREYVAFSAGERTSKRAHAQRLRVFSLPLSWPRARSGHGQPTELGRGQKTIHLRYDTRAEPAQGSCVWLRPRRGLLSCRNHTTWASSFAQTFVP